MTTRKTRPIPPVCTKAYATEGGLYASPSVQESAVKFEMHHCTAYLNQQETLQMVCQVIHAGQQVFGPPFLEKVGYYLEQMEG